jgi:hypothetical protein
VKISQIYTEDGVRLADVDIGTYFYYANHAQNKMVAGCTYQIRADQYSHSFYLDIVSCVITPVEKSDGNFFLPNVFTTQVAAYSALKAKLVKELDDLIEKAKSRGV